jgi:hypothetical protein
MAALLAAGWEHKWERDLLASALSGFFMLTCACADLCRCGFKPGGGVAVAILTSEGSLVRSQLRPPVDTQDSAVGFGVLIWLKVDDPAWGAGHVE